MLLSFLGQLHKFLPIFFWYWIFCHAFHTNLIHTWQWHLRQFFLFFEETVSQRGLTKNTQLVWSLSFFVSWLLCLISHSSCFPFSRQLLSCLIFSHCLTLLPFFLTAIPVGSCKVNTILLINAVCRSRSNYERCSSETEQVSRPEVSWTW